MLPRNHDGNGPVTKARAHNETLQAISEQAGYELEKVPIVAIDDALHHAKTYSENGVKTFVPGYDWNTSATNHQSVTRIERDLPGTIDTFIAVDRYLAQYF